jgi:predicted nuclease with TOPRIM domain
VNNKIEFKTRNVKIFNYIKMSQVTTCIDCGLVCKSRGGLTNHQRKCPNEIKAFAQQQIDAFAQELAKVRQELKQGIEHLHQNDVQLSNGINQFGQQGAKLVEKIDQIQETVDHIQDQFEFICALIQEKNKIFDLIENALNNQNLDVLTPACNEMLKLVLNDTNDYQTVFKEGEYQLLLENPEYAQPFCQRIDSIKQLAALKNLQLVTN